GADDWTVLELSSFQLHDLNRLPSSPGIAVVTGFAPNHLDWHSSLADYRSAKQTILRWQTPLDTAVLNADDQDVAAWSCWGRRLEFGCLPTAGEPADRAAVEREGLWLTGDGPEILCRLNGCEDTFPLGSWVRQPGRHNLANAMAAACAAVQAGAGWEDVQSGLEKFGGLPHRLEPVGAAGNVRFINDSLATTPESVQVALAALDGPLVLLAGGYDKQIDLSPLAECIARKAMSGQLQAVGLMGQTAELLQEMITARLDPSAGIQLRQARTFDEAFHWAVSQAVPGGTVLLSPGCASYDWFRDFAERGARFKELVLSLRSC
ncbi:MAG: UDP-N-acetylmuramoyl-L-alanine--D-glutamate ligase, partial [Planctomycetaceae bacterium]|nr:UDP-N-acetylmuramoyl-L-alanine--D-glutamate ligase [Planctomycetaceae bacterium]